MTAEFSFEMSRFCLLLYKEKTFWVEMKRLLGSVSKFLCITGMPKGRFIEVRHPNYISKCCCRHAIEAAAVGHV